MRLRRRGGRAGAMRVGLDRRGRFAGVCGFQLVFEAVFTTARIMLERSGLRFGASLCSSVLGVGALAIERLAPGGDYVTKRLALRYRAGPASVWLESLALIPPERGCLLTSSWFRPSL